MNVETQRVMRILILYASEHGQTEAVAQAIAARLEKAGHDVDFVNSRTPAPSPSDYDVVVVGSRIEAESPARRIRRFVRQHRHELAAIPTAFFSVSMSAASRAAPGRVRAQETVDRFSRATGWTPRWCATFGGALPYLRYGVFLRWLMKRIAGATGGPVDTTRNHDLTDWDEVARFADRIAADLGGSAVLSTPPPPSPVDGVTGNAVGRPSS